MSRLIHRATIAILFLIVFTMVYMITFVAMQVLTGR